MESLLVEEKSAFGVVFFFLLLLLLCVGDTDCKGETVMGSWEPQRCCYCLEHSGDLLQVYRNRDMLGHPSSSCQDLRLCLLFLARGGQP